MKMNRRLNPFLALSEAVRRSRAGAVTASWELHFRAATNKYSPSMKLKQILYPSIKSVIPAAAALLLGGCASSGVKNPSGVGVTEMRPDERGFVAGTGVESTDIVSATDKMTREILSIPEIASATTPPFIVTEPVINNTRFPINKTIFLTRMRQQLNEKARGKIRFLARESIATLERERQLKQTGQVTASSDPKIQEFRGADYFLTGKLEGQSTRTSQGISDYILYTFQLIDARTSVIVYDGGYEIKKQGLEDASYR
jgi:PBP1b-binding outer membrane lipoprotein LpoB